MVQLDKEELLKLAQRSSLRLDEDEIADFSDRLKALLDYVDELRDVEVVQGLDPIRNINVFREDKIVITDSTPLLQQAPEVEENAIVVPKIID